MKPVQADRRALERAVTLVSGHLEDHPEGTPTIVAPPDVPLPGRPKGPRENAVLDLPELAQRPGLLVAQISDRIGTKLSHTYKVLHGLEAAGLLEVVPGSEPHRYRLAHRRQAAVDDFIRFADTVSRGEWTTCADISLASRGDTAAASLVCWAATFVPAFPAPHRVLLEGGRLHPLGHDHARRRPGLLHPQLVDEAIGFDHYGRADRRSRIGWDDLRSRVRARRAVVRS